MFRRWAHTSSIQLTLQSSNLRLTVIVTSEFLQIYVLQMCVPSCSNFFFTVLLALNNIGFLSSWFGVESKVFQLSVTEGASGLCLVERG